MDSQRKRRNRQRVAAGYGVAVISATLLVALLLVSALTVPLVTVFRSSSGGGEEDANCTAPLLPPLFENPTEVVRVQEIEVTSFSGGHCLAFNTDDNLLYSFHGKDPGQHTLRAYNTSGYPDVSTTLPFGPNLIPGATYTSGMNKVTACAYEPATGCFLNTDTSATTLFRTCLNGTTAAIGLFNHSTGSTIRGFAVNAQGELYALDLWNELVIQFDTNTAQTIGPEVPISFDLWGGFIYSFTYSAYYDQYYAVQRRDGVNYVVGLDISTGIVRESCTYDSDLKWSGSLTIDNNGRVWMASGGDGDYPFHIYFQTSVSAPFFQDLDLKPNNLTFTRCIDYPSEANLTYDSNFTELEPILGGTGCCTGETKTCSVASFNRQFAINSYHPTSRNVASNSIVGTMQESHEHTAISAVLVENNVVPEPINATEFNEGQEMLNETRKRIPTSTYNPAPPPTWLFSHASSIGDYFGADPSVRDEHPMISLDSDSSGTFNLLGVRNGYALFVFEAFGYTGIVSATGLFSSGDCQQASTEYYIRYDNEASRWILIWTASTRDTLCIASSTTASITGAYDIFTMTDPGWQDMRKLTFGIWGDYYNVCWNNMGTGAYGTCYILERQRILFGGGAPRLLQIQTPDAIGVLGHPLTVAIHHRGPNMGQRGDVMIAFPCGVFSVMSSDQGGILDMRLCQSVNFDTSSIMSVNSRTTVGPYDDGSTGACPSLIQCVPINNTAFMDPNRYDVMTAYRHFPDRDGMERMAAAITIDADGNKNSKILWGEFIMNMDGSLSPIGDGMYTFDPYPGSFTMGRHVYSPAVAYTPSGMLIMQWKAGKWAPQGLMSHHNVIRFISWPPGSMSPPGALGLAEQNHGNDLLSLKLMWTNTPRIDIVVLKDERQDFATANTWYYVGTSRRTSLRRTQYTIGADLILKRTVAYDRCRNSATCTQSYWIDSGAFEFAQP